MIRSRFPVHHVLRSEQVVGVQSPGSGRECPEFDPEKIRSSGHQAHHRPHFRPVHRGGKHRVSADESIEEAQGSSHSLHHIRVQSVRRRRQRKIRETLALLDGYGSRANNVFCVLLRTFK